MNNFLQKNGIFLVWVVSVMATLGSLFFSLVMNLPPCDLCWYQRIAMYPLVVILAVGLIKKDGNSLLYSIILTFFGWLIAVYHNLLYYNILPESAAPCTAGISCTKKYIEWFGFVTIPLLSLVAFTFILAILCFVRKSYTK